MLFIYSMYSLLLVVLLGHITSTYSAEQAKLSTRHLLAFVAINPLAKNAEDKKQDVKFEDKTAVVNVASINNEKNGKPHEEGIVASKSSTPAPQKSSTPKRTGNDDNVNHYNKPIEMESGALLRGVLVVVSLTIILLIYIGAKTCYGRRNKQPIVRKYGVRTRRSDIEMTPLPLDEDDEDETLFDVNNSNR